jgi:hypothetical protein
MFKPAVKATSAEGVGKYAIKFHFNDGHELGIYSWCGIGVRVRSARRRGLVRRVSRNAMAPISRGQTILGYLQHPATLPV